MANLIVITGPQAVGKMTVAEVLRDQIGYSLMVNHDSIEISDKIFRKGSEAQKELNRAIRKDVFDIAIKYDINLIFTFITAFDLQKDLDYLKKLQIMFEKNGGSFYFVELKTDLNIRLKRNTTPHRLEMKFSKNNIEESIKDLLETSEKYRVNSYNDEFICENHIKIDNTNLAPNEVVKIIREKFPTL